MIAGLRSIREAGDLKGKRVFVRADFNVPVKDGKVADPARIDQSFATISFLQHAGAKIILAPYLGRKPEETLSPVEEYLKDKLPARFVSTVSDLKEAITRSVPDEIVLYNDLKEWEGAAAVDAGLAKELAECADIYVNEAFSESHRSVTLITELPKHFPRRSYAGFGFEREVENLSKALRPAHPSLFILAGAKFETKIVLVEKFLTIADHVFVGGALANDVLKAKGCEVGRSLVSDPAPDLSNVISNPKLIPIRDVMVNEPAPGTIKRVDETLPEDALYDIGPDTIRTLAPLVAQAKQIVWNGPLGAYEKGFTAASHALAKLIAESSAETIIGGGDTLAVIKDLGLSGKFFFVSSAGGAMLEFLEKGTLPGIEALRSK